MSTRRSRVAATRAAWRIARRDARRHAWRSLLVVVMIGLPVAGVVFFDVTFRTADLSPAQRADQLLGSADALVRDTDAASVTQLADPDDLGWSSEGTRSDEADRLATLPSSWSVVTDRVVGDARFLSSDGSRARFAAMQELAYDDPVVAGLVRQVDGRAPEGGDEVAITARLADRLDLAVGDRLVPVTGSGGFDVVGIVDVSADLNAERVIGDPGAFSTLDEVETRQFFAFPSVYVDAGGPVTWDQVRELNAQGLLVVSRAVLVDPPDCGADYPCDQFGVGGGISAETLTLIGLVVVMALLQVVLLSGPAFAIGRRTQSHDLALVAASGGDRRHVGGVIRGGGILLGGFGAGLGAVLAVVGFVLLRPTLSSLNGSVLPAVDLRPLEILAIVAVGVLTGLAAAWLPARQAARQDVVAALGGRRPTPRLPKRVPVIGAVAVVIGAVVALYGAGPGDALAIVAGSVIAELGLVAMSPTLVAWVARVGPWLPAVPRLALRDAARSRTRSGPAVAAVMAAIAGAVAVSIFATSQEAADRRGFVPSLREGWAAVFDLSSPGSNTDPKDFSADVAVVEAELPVERTYLLQGYRPDWDACLTEAGCEQLSVVVPPENQCPYAADGAIAPADEAAAGDDWRCVGGRGFSSVFAEWVVADRETYAALSGDDDPSAGAVLDAGGVVLLDRAYVLDGRATFEVSRVSDVAVPIAGADVERAAQREAEPEVLRSATMSAAVADPSTIGVGRGVLSPEAAARLGIPVDDIGALFETSRMPTEDEQDRADRQLQLTDDPAGLFVERGYQDETAVVLLVLLAVTAVIALGATAIAVGLSAADARPDLATLAAIGASPRTRRLLTASQAALIAGLGTVLGIVAGFVPGIAAVRTQTDWSSGQILGGSAPPTLPVVIPWSNLVLLLVAIPLLAAICGALFSRSRLPMVRRLG